MELPLRLLHLSRASQKLAREFGLHTLGDLLNFDHSSLDADPAVKPLFAKLDGELEPYRMFLGLEVARRRLSFHERLSRDREESHVVHDVLHDLRRFHHRTERVQTEHEICGDNMLPPGTHSGFWDPTEALQFHDTLKPLAAHYLQSRGGEASFAVSNIGISPEGAYTVSVSREAMQKVGPVLDEAKHMGPLPNRGREHPGR